VKFVTVGIAECKTSNAAGQALVTYALGSCVALAVHDRVAGVGGMLHFMLPEAGIDPAKAREYPCMFADTGIPLLFRRCYELGADKRRMVVYVAGGAQVMNDAQFLNIGKRNLLAMRKILWRAGVLIHSEAVGGSVSRTLRLEMDTGRAWLRSEGLQETEMILATKGGPRGIACPDCR
jgi:chemotaxis protein CheD